jgi:hypothetical protein
MDFMGIALHFAFRDTGIPLSTLSPYRKRPTSRLLLKKGGCRVSPNDSLPVVASRIRRRHACLKRHCIFGGRTPTKPFDESFVLDRLFADRRLSRIGHRIEPRRNFCRIPHSWPCFGSIFRGQVEEVVSRFWQPGVGASRVSCET